MPFVVTGISQDGDTSALEKALTAAGLSLDAFEVLGPDDAGSLAGSLAGGGLVDTGILTGGGLDTGTGVPGITGSGVPGVTSGPRLNDVDGSSVWDRLADFEIPDDEVENYAEALEAGRSIVAYFANAGNVAKVESAFTNAGLAKVKTF